MNLTQGKNCLPSVNKKNRGPIQLRTCLLGQVTLSGCGRSLKNYTFGVAIPHFDIISTALGVIFMGHSKSTNTFKNNRTDE